MALLVTGATGFVMSVLARRWLEADPAARLSCWTRLLWMPRRSATSPRSSGRLSVVTRAT